MTLAGALVDAAVRNNADWCDALCSVHGLCTERDAAAWSSPSRPPTFYPDAVTLRPSLRAEQVLNRIDTAPGCSVKDSYADIDLSTAGFRVLSSARACSGAPTSSSSRTPAAARSSPGRY